MQYVFDAYAIDPDRRELRRGGELVDIEPQVFDLLVYIVRNRDRVVSKDELLTKIWRGRVVSDSTISSRINAIRRAVGDSGEQQQFIRTIPRRGIRFVGEVCENLVSSKAARDPFVPQGRRAAAAPHQDLTFCRAPDGVKLAVATLGDGPPLVKAGNWLSHIEHDWKSPLWSPLLSYLAERSLLVRYDMRGNGLSDWDVADSSLEVLVTDLETVVDSLGLERFDLLGMCQGAPVSIAYAARHPERVSRLVLCGGYAQGCCRRSAAKAAERDTFLSLVRHGWGQEHPLFRQIFTSMFIPGATVEEMRVFSEMQRISASPENAVRFTALFGDVDVAKILPRVMAPTLVLHSRGDSFVPLDHAVALTRAIPKARLIALESRNHLPVPGEPAWDHFLGEISGFLWDETARVPVVA